MVFSSVTFLCIFFPIVFLLHAVLPNGKARNAALILASILFYAYGEPVYVILLLISVIFNYLFGLGVAGAHKKGVLTVAVIVNIGLLFVFKYAGFFVTSLNSVLPAKSALPVPKLSLPIGISFYTFQALSYVIDVYRGKADVQRNFFRLLLYVSFFPQLIAGPIVKYHDIENEIRTRNATVDDIFSGLTRFSIGLGKKVLIANTMAYVADAVFAMPKSYIGLLASWVAAIAYLMQIYFDFSGYSDMAIGLGRMFGFHFQENFNYPYIADSIREFWRRWHISLSTWFRDYLYIPLGGNRKGKARTILNKYIVFFCTGFWHGANWTFLVWGLFHGTLQMAEEKEWIPVHRGWKVFNHIYVLLMVTIGFVVFRADTLSQAGSMIAAMFGFGAGTGFGMVKTAAILSPYVIVVMLCAAVGCTPLPRKMALRLQEKSSGRALGEYASMALSLAILVLALMALAAESYNPFIYFRF
ncbi:MAG: MBOAT family protein [Lachnospiraceae bacterium]|nr:MBOAT family protein [Lachnospiraceae bacterium]